MKQRLIENWLDSINERAYQAPFCQLLQSNGYTIIHSTRHSPIEFGVDVTALNPDGEICHYQLKGEPGARFTASKFRAILSQIQQMVYCAPLSPGHEERPRRNYLVVNADVDEEATFCIQRFNEEVKRSSGNLAILEVVNRGEILKMALDASEQFWPETPSDFSLVLQLMSEDGKGILDYSKLEHINLDVLRADQEISLTVRQAKRSVVASSIIMFIVLQNYYKQENNVQIVFAWALWIVNTLGVLNRRFGNEANDILQHVDLMQAHMFERLADVSDEVLERASFSEGDGISDVVYYKYRLQLLVSLLSIYQLAMVSGYIEKESSYDRICSFINSKYSGNFIWGEAAIPSLLVTGLSRSTFAGDISIDIAFFQVAKQVIAANKRSVFLLSPYSDYSAYIRHKILSDKKLDYSLCKGRSYFLLSVFHILVSLNLKRLCKDIWADITKIGHVVFRPSSPWHYCTLKTAEGIEEQLLLPPRETWDNVIKMIPTVPPCGVPAQLIDRLPVLCIFLLIAPYRATPEVVRLISRSYMPAWY